jgi:quercetin dioxygenase-like cupin family protein
MSNPNNNPAGIHELATLYALDALDARERHLFEQHLLAGCSDCSETVRSVQAIAADLASTVAVEPPPALRNRLMERVASTPRLPGIAYDEAGLLIARSQEIEWKPFAPGVNYKPLFSDKARNTDTMLVRVDPGARIPSHKHSQIEEIFVLSGDLRVEGQAMYAGDYCRADLGSVHDLSYSETGCVFLIMTSPDNEMLV